MRFIVGIILLSAQVVALAGLPPTSLGSLAGSKTTFFSQAPFNQYTQVSGVTGRIETGNENILPNQNFEAKILNWSLFSGSGTVSINTGAAAMENQSMEIVASPGPTAGAAVSSIISIPKGLLSNNMQFFCRFKSTSTISESVTMSVQDNGANVLGSTTFSTASTASGPTNTLQGFNFVTNFTMTGILPIITMNTSGGDILVDDCYLGPAINIGFAMPTTIWQSYTPTFTGFGTVSSSNCQWRQSGPNLQTRCTFTVGTPTAVEARVSFPTTSMISFSSNPTLSIVGSATRNASSAEDQIVLTEPSINYFTFGVQSGSTSGLAKANGSAITSAGQVYSFFAEVPITGWAGSVQALNPNCNNDGSCVNQFVARISTGGVVSATNVPNWINGNCTITNTSEFTCNFASNLFSQAPVCFFSYLTNSFTATVRENTATTTSAGDWMVVDSATGAARLLPFSVSCVRQGSDIRPQVPMPVIIGGVTTSNSTGSEDIEKVSFGGASEPSVCSSSPCTMYRHTPGITSVTRTGAGQYTINFASGTFSSAPVCVSQTTGFSLSGWTQRQTGTVPTTTTYQIQTIVNSSVGDSGAVDIICMGTK